MDEIKLFKSFNPIQLKAGEIKLRLNLFCFSVNPIQDGRGAKKAPLPVFPL